VNPEAVHEAGWPVRGRILALDPGERRIGAAISDPDRTIASPLETWTRKGNDPDSRWLRLLVVREGASALIVGLPLRSQGEEGESARRARGFAGWAARVSGLPVRMVDESFTTRFAEHALWDMGLSHKDRRARRDAVAAQLLLQGFLEAGCPPDPANPEPSPGSTPQP
jgi:putative Holliday junction resolvase